MIDISKNTWSEKELKILKYNYSNLTKDELLKVLPDRSWSSILTKANKIGVNKRYSWTNKEDVLLKEIYSNIPMKEVLIFFLIEL